MVLSLEPNEFLDDVDVGLSNNTEVKTPLLFLACPPAPPAPVGSNPHAYLRVVEASGWKQTRYRYGLIFESTREA
jgi:hypothetical protein